MFLGRRGQGERCSALAIIWRAREPQYVFGAATRHLHRNKDMQSGHDAEG